MTDQPDKPTPPRKPPYDFGPNARDVTAERAGTPFAIVGAQSMQKGVAPVPAPGASPERK